MRRVRILEAAAEEIVEAVAWYERQRPGLGVDFSRAVDAALDLLEDEVVPLLAPTDRSAARHGAKRLILRRFPYDVVVRESGNEILVVAVAHHSRRPGYWKDRPDI